MRPIRRQVVGLAAQLRFTGPATDRSRLRTRRIAFDRDDCSCRPCGGVRT